jgi:hypothetical protein
LFTTQQYDIEGFLDPIGLKAPIFAPEEVGADEKFYINDPEWPPAR